MLKCPHCHEGTSFSVEVTDTLILDADGNVDNIQHDTEWDNSNLMTCVDCGHEDKASAFKES